MSVSVETQQPDEQQSKPRNRRALIAGAVVAAIAVAGVVVDTLTDSPRPGVSVAAGSPTATVKLDDCQTTPNLQGDGTQYLAAVLSITNHRDYAITVTVPVAFSEATTDMGTGQTSQTEVPAHSTVGNVYASSGSMVLGHPITGPRCVVGNPQVVW